MGRLIYTILMIAIAATSWVLVSGMEECCAHVYHLGVIMGIIVALAATRLNGACEYHRELKQKRKAKKTHMSGHKRVPNWPDPPRCVTHRRGR